MFSLHFFSLLPLLPFKRFIFTVKQTKGKSFFLYCQLLSLRFEVLMKTIKSRALHARQCIPLNTTATQFISFTLPAARSTRSQELKSKNHRKLLFFSALLRQWWFDDSNDLTKWRRGELVFNVSSLHISIAPNGQCNEASLRHVERDASLLELVKIRSMR